MKRVVFLSLLICLCLQSYGTQWHNAGSHILGRWWNSENAGNYNRFPERFKSSLTKDVWGLSTNSAGLYIKFLSDSRNITVRYTLTSRSLEMWHMPSTGVSGVDMYLRDSDHRERWCASSRRNFSDTVTYVFSDMEYGEAAEFTLFLPLYNGVSYMEIGVDDTAKFSFLPEPEGSPIVVYGTSIAQGACASRPGLAWSNILQRRLQKPVINFGFSGNGLLHDAMFEAMSEIDASVYIIDCMPNMAEANRKDSIVPRIQRGLSVLRAKSKAPVILVEHDGYMNEMTVPDRFELVAEVNRNLRKAYDSLRVSGYRDIYYLSKEDIGMNGDSQVDASHSNDYGMLLYAEAYLRLLQMIF